MSFFKNLFFNTTQEDKQTVKSMEELSLAQSKTIYDYMSKNNNILHTGGSLHLATGIILSSCRKHLTNMNHGKIKGLKVYHIGKRRNIEDTASEFTYSVKENFEV